MSAGRTTRREALLALGALPVAARASKPGAAPAAAKPVPIPFARGDVVVGCTLLNDPKDDHRGLGRILHYDSKLTLRNTIVLEDTTHIVQGTRFGPDRTLWAFDTFSYRIVRIGADGRRMPNFTAAPARGFGHISFAPDGRFFLGENYVGEKSRLPLRTTLPFIPGTKRFGDGHLFEFSPKGRLVQEHGTRTHGGLGGFQGLTSSAIAPDGRTVYYTSESGPIIFRYDLSARRQLPDLLNLADKPGQYFFDVAFDGQGRLLVVRGQGIDALDPASGATLRSYPLQSFGWASMSPPIGARTHVYATNFFTGEIVKLDLASGTVTARANVGIRKSVAGAAEFPG